MSHHAVVALLGGGESCPHEELLRALERYNAFVVRERDTLRAQGKRLCEIQDGLVKELEHFKLQYTKERDLTVKLQRELEAARNVKPARSDGPPA